MNRLRAIAHLLRHGHRREPWAIHLWDEPAPPVEGCRACIHDAVIRDIADQRRLGGGGW